MTRALRKWWLICIAYGFAACGPGGTTSVPDLGGMDMTQSPLVAAWKNTTPPSGAASQYSSYSTTVVFGHSNSVSVDLETTHSPGALVYAGCNDSIKGLGSYTVQNNILNTTFQSGSTLHTGCTFPTDNGMSSTLDAATMMQLISLTSGTFVLSANTLAITYSSSLVLQYTKQ